MSRSVEISACGLDLRVVDVPVLGHIHPGDSRTITYVYERGTGATRDPLVATAGLGALMPTQAYRHLNLGELTAAVDEALRVAA